MTKEEVISFIDKNKGKAKIYLIQLNNNLIYSTPRLCYTATELVLSDNPDDRWILRFDLNNIKNIFINYTSLNTSVTFGSDPEFFFTKDDKVIPSNLVIPNNPYDKSVIVDGFQGELNPLSSSCRQVAALYIGRALTLASNYAKKINAELSLNVGHIISDDVWKKTPMSLKRFGCNPTQSVYKDSFKRVTGLREKFRAAGGHIHLGISSHLTKGDNLIKLVKLMDILGGNTAVLIDRDKDNATRRKNYGRAGEHRIKKYGIEYRVYSNFWLKHYTLWSFAAAQLKVAVALTGSKLGDELIESINITDIKDAINNNDYSLALKNFMIVAEFFKKHNIYQGYGIDVTNIDSFIKWATEENPLKKFKIDTQKNIISNWQQLERTYPDGFEKFLQNNY